MDKINHYFLSGNTNKVIFKEEILMQKCVMYLK